MSDLEREQIELGIVSMGRFDIDNCTCDASVGYSPCHYCAERGAIFAGRRVLEKLAVASADIDRLNQMLRETGYGQGQIDSYAAECEARERAEEERDEARAWIARYYQQWEPYSPTAVDLRSEMPWLEHWSEKAGDE